MKKRTAGIAVSDNDRWLERPDDEYADDGPSDEDYPDDDYPDDDDDFSETVSCPECGSEVYEDAVRCPICEAYITHSSNIWSGKPLWWILLGLLGSGALILALLGV